MDDEPLSVHARPAALLLLASGSAALLSLASTYVFLKVRPPAEFGAFQYAFAVAASVVFFSFPGLHTAVTQALARGFGANAWRALRVRALGALGGSLVLALFGIEHMVAGEGEVARALFAAAVAVPVAYSLDTVQSVLNGMEAFRLLALHQALTALAAAAAVVGTALGGRPPWIAMAGVLLAPSLVSLAFLLVLRRRVRGPFDPALHDFGRHLTYLGAFAGAVAYVDSIVVALFLGVDALAVFAAARLFPAALKQGWVVVGQVLAPRLARARTPAAWRTSTRALPVVALVFAAGAGALAAAAAVTVPRWFPPAYAPVPIIALGLMAASVAYVPGQVFELFLQSRASLRRLSVLRTSWPAFSLVATIALGWAYGLAGVVVAAVAAAVFHSVVAWGLAHREFRAAQTSLTSAALAR